MKTSHNTEKRLEIQKNYLTRLSEDLIRKEIKQTQDELCINFHMAQTATDQIEATENLIKYLKRNKDNDLFFYEDSIEKWKKFLKIWTDKVAFCEKKLEVEYMVLNQKTASHAN